MSKPTGTQRLILRGIIQPLWRWQRPLTLGAQGVVVDAEGRVLLVRHTYRPGWCFPGGGVEKGETVLTALTRELDEECGVKLAGPPELSGVYSNHEHFPNDHVVLFIVRDYTRPRIPAPNREIAEQGFFPAGALPENCSDSTTRRIGELFFGAPRSEFW